jgi:hypothetical protein
MKGKLLMLDFTNGGFLAYINDCERQENIQKAINMFATGYNVEDEWDQEVVLAKCHLEDLTNEEGQAILRALGK